MSDSSTYSKRVIKRLRSLIPESDLEKYKQTWDQNPWKRFEYELKYGYKVKSYEDIKDLYLVDSYKNTKESKKFKQKQHKSFSKMNEKISNLWVRQQRKFYEMDLQNIENLRNMVKNDIETWRQEITKQFKDQGKNIKNVNTGRNIENEVDKRVIEEYGHNTEYYLNQSAKTIYEDEKKRVELLKQKPDPFVELNRELIFDTPDEELTPLERTMKYDFLFRKTLHRIDMIKLRKRMLK